jgi:1-acyl-sn-glycerol-3-phosphate acyltransferase
MSVDTIARLTLAGYCLLFVAGVLWRAARCPYGWRLWVLHAITKLYGRLGFHWRANRPCPFLNTSPAIVIANHRGPVDPLLVWLGVTNCRPIEFLTAQEYFGTPGLQFIFEATRAISVARDGKDMGATRTALRRLKEGRWLGVFPEGRFNEEPGTRLLPGDTGVAWLALHSQAPVFPVFIHNSPRGKDMITPLYKFTRVRVIYGDPIDLTAYFGKRITSELLQEVIDLLMERLAALGGVAATLLRKPEPDESPNVIRMPDAG